MSNMDNFSADELLKRLKENMGGEGNAKDETSDEPAEVETEVEEAAEEVEVIEEAVEQTEEAASPKVYTKKKYKFAKRAVREVAVESPAEVETEAEHEVQTEDKVSAVSDATMAFGIPTVSEPEQQIDDKPTEEFRIVDKVEDEEFDAPTIEMSGITELEAPDMEAFEAAAEDSSVQSAEDNVFKGYEERAELDDVDMGLMIALGLEDQLKEQVGEEKVNEFETSLGLEIEHSVPEEEKPSGFAFSGDEYEKHEQTPEVFEKYKTERSRLNMRLLGSAILAVCLLIFENLHLLGLTLPGAFNVAEYPAVHIFVCLQLLVLCAALSYKEIIAGFVSVAKFEFTSNTLAAFVVAFTALCDLLIAFFASGSEVRLYNFAAAFILVLCILHDYLNLKREMYAFGIVSSKKPKYAVVTEAKTSVVERDYGFEREDEDTDLLLNVKKVDFVDNYFKRTNAKTDAGKYTPYFIFGALAISLILALISFANTKNAGTAFAVANLTALMCLPVSLFSVSSLPFFLASKSAFEKDSAIIGEASVDEYAGASTVVFDDKDIFPARSVKVKSVKVYGENRIDTVLYDMTSIFSKLGGPLYEVLSKATAEIGASEDVELTESADSGASAKIDSERTVLVGDSLYMEQNDIFPTYDYEDEIQLAGGNIRIMYVAYEGELAAKIYVQYAIDPDFDSVLRQLHRNGMNIVIKTMDPNIDNTLLVGKAKPANYPAKIEKRPIEEAGEKETGSLDSGIVSRANTKSLVSAILLCDKLQHVKLTANIVKFMSVIVSLVIMMIFVISNSSVLILSVFVAAYHLFWVLPVFAVSKLYLN